MTATIHDFHDRSPLYLQVRELIRQKALGGEIVDDSGRLMTEAELVAYFGVSRVTVRNALAPLVESGMFDRTPGRGTFLRSNQAERWVGRLLGFQEAITEAGFRPGARILDMGMTSECDQAVRDALEEPAVWQLKRVRYANDTPIAIEWAFYPPGIGAELAGRDLLSIRMYEVFEKELGLEIKAAEQVIGARLSDRDEEVALGLASTGALIAMTRVTRTSDGRAIEFLRAVYRPDYFQFSIKLNRSKV
ncbi:GntR family transcriptional regulator [Devosia nitrariae]|uniref:GntR family transcriptional regulator n=1 Tax=Devosia nitrariae TaxID=2071872 RepID=A0ABQ5W897_9HYPH|nr:GntR family transcriptional regulator [Devosia nitrariae]GLQ55810.1 GntR family transcriptional regulator [Devosia nitrariae]